MTVVPRDGDRPAPLLPLGAELREVLARAPLLLFLDVDGTLAPIASRPEEAVVPAETKRAVTAVAALDDTRVALVSGRSASDARRMVAATHVWAVGNHGSEAVGPDGEEIVDDRVAPYEAVLAQAARRLEALLRPVPGVIVEDKRWSLSVHYRLADPAIVPGVQATVTRVAVELGLTVHEGKKVFEVRAPVSVDKGTAIISLVERLGDDGATIAFVGDDRTDEDAFRAMRERYPDGVTVRVVHGQDVPTLARYTLEDTNEVRAFLEELVRLRNDARR